MKKLMFATALGVSVVGFGATAAPVTYNATSFEGYTADAAVVGAGGGDVGESGVGVNYFYYDGDSDASLVKEFGDVVAPTITRPYYWASSNNTQYLELSTEGGILWRSINQINTTDGVSLGDAQQVAADGTYLDTLVQFTPTEDGGDPTLEDGVDKLAIWLNVDSQGNTNLMVRAGWVDAMGQPVATNFVLTGTSVVAGEWYRLTIKAVPNIIDTEGAYGSFYNIPAFMIYVDGTEMAATTSPIDASLANLDGTIASGFATLVAANKVFPSIVPPAAGVAYALQGVGFKGSGALDDIVWTEEDPFALPADGFTLTWPAGMTAVSYTLGTGSTPVPITGSSPFMIRGVEDGALIYFLVQNADGAQKTLQATKGDGVTGINATGTTFGWPEYLGNAVNGAYTIDDADDLGMLRKGVAAGLATVGETFNQTANIDMSSAGPFAGIGTYNANLTNGVPFCGTYDGQGYKISNIDFTQRNYGGVFNQVKGGTIKNLTVDTITCSTFDSSVNSGEWGCSIIGNVGLGSTVQGLTAMGSFGSAGTPCTHNVAGIAIRVCGGASNVVNGVIMLETLVKDCTNNATLYGCYTKAGGITALTQDQNGVPNDYVLFDGCVNNASITMVSGSGKEGRDGLGGILGYATDGTKMQNCANRGTTFSTPLANATNVAQIVGWPQGKFLTDLGGNSGLTNIVMLGKGKGSTITGFQYASVNDGVATTTTTLAKDTRFLLERDVAASATPVFTLAAEGDWIEFDTALGYTFAGTVAGEGVTSETTGTVTKYWIPGAEPADYQVVIGNDTEHPVSVTLDDADFAMMDAMGVDTNSVQAVNYALNMSITNNVKAWEIAILGIPFSDAGVDLDAFKIDSITIGADGKVSVTMGDGIAPKTGRGVDITLKLLGSSDLVNWDTEHPIQTVTNPTLTQENPAVVFPPITPAFGETKKFYKVVVEFSATQN